jgi:hypothetical protein
MLHVAATHDRLICTAQLLLLRTFRLCTTAACCNLWCFCIVAERGQQWLQTEFMRVDIETTSLLAAGQTVCDVWGQSNQQKNVHVAKVYTDLIHHVSLSCREQYAIQPVHPNLTVSVQAMDVPGFWQLQCAAVEAANAQSPMNDGHADIKVEDL